MNWLWRVLCWSVGSAIGAAISVGSGGTALPIVMSAAAGFLIGAGGAEYKINTSKKIKKLESENVGLKEGLEAATEEVNDLNEKIDQLEQATSIAEQRITVLEEKEKKEDERVQEEFAKDVQLRERLSALNKKHYDEEEDLGSDEEQEMNLEVSDLRETSENQMRIK